MAISWITVLQNVPWGEVISNAPKVADGAKKLWNTVAKKPPLDEMPDANTQSELAPDSHAIATLQAQISVIESAMTDLHHQLLASSELIKALAEQNTQLIQRVESHRVRVLWLTCATAVLGIAATASLAMVLLR